MFFNCLRKIKYFSLISIFGLLILSCGIKVGEKTPEQKPAEVQSAQCLKPAIDDLKVYFSGEAADEQVSRSVQCLQDVFIAFKENIRGENKDAYTAREIATFVEINFLTPQEKADTAFTDQFLQQLMLFKVALFGGTKDFILKSEVDLIADFLARFKPELVRLNPHMKILTMNWTEKLGLLSETDKEQKFLAAKDQFAIFIKKICTEFARGQREYLIEDLLNFAIETAKFSKADQSTIDTLEKSKPFLKKFKTNLIGGSLSLKGKDWEKMGLIIEEAYFQTLRIDYFLKKVNPDEIDKKWLIYEKIATDLTGLIENLLLTKETQSLSNKEIDDLLQSLNQILPGVGFNEEILNSLGDIKVMLLGEGQLGRKGWTKKDFESLNKKIPTLFRNIAVLIETIDYLNPQKNQKFRDSITYDDFKKSEIKILIAVYNLSQLIEKSYDLASFKKLLNELAAGPLHGSLKLPENFDGLFETMIAGKHLITSHQGSFTSIDDLRLILNTGIKFYLNYTEYDLFVSQNKIESSQYVVNLNRVWQKIKTNLTQFLSNRIDPVITTEQISYFILTAQEQKVLGTELTKNALDKAFNSLWSNLLNRTEDRLQSLVRKGLDQVALEQAFIELDLAIGIQQNLNQIFEKSSVWPKKELIIALNEVVQNQQNGDIKLGLEEILKIVQQPISLTFNENGFLRILETPSGSYHLNDLFQSNISRLVSRWVIKSYANDLLRATLYTGVLKDELQTAYDQFKPLLVDLKIVDVANVGFINSRFIEANLFLSVSDGDQTASFQELHHLVIHILSGLKRAQELRIDIEKNCEVFLTPLDQKQRTVAEDCLLNVYQQNTSGFLGLPQFLATKKLYSEDLLKEYYLNLLKAAGYVPNEQKQVLLSDADLFPHVVQYIEMVYARHDLNADNYLQKDEALAAFPIFKDLLKDLVKPYKQIKEEDLPGVFVYILKYGRPPKASSIGEVLKFVAFIKDKNQTNWNINSTRLDLGKIFNYIADSIKTNPIAK